MYNVSLTYTADYPPLYNDPEVTADVVSSLKNMSDPDIKEVGEYPDALWIGRFCLLS